MNNTENIFGCFVSVTQPYANVNQEIKDLALEQGRLFRSYIWSEKGICNTLKKLNHVDYGKDLKLVLFQFYVNPLPVEVQNLKAIENYRKREKSIGMSIIVNDENFFSKSEKGRYNFLKKSILQKLDLLVNVVKQKKLDTKMDLLKSDVQKLLSC